MTTTSETRSFSTRNMVLCALMAAVTAVCAQIAIPMPSGVSVTLQTFAVALCGYLLEWKYGLASVAVYILLGMVGAPVFTGFKGGIGVIVGVTGGFIVGFLPMVFLCGISPKLKDEKLTAAAEILLGAAGVLTCHVTGVIWFAVSTHTSLAASFLRVSLPYMAKDILSVVLAWILCRTLKKALSRWKT